MPAPFIRQLALGPMQNFVYLVGAADSTTCAVIDCAWDAGAVRAAAEEAGRTITHALVSHWHFDHTNGLVPLLEQQGVRVCVHASDAEDLPRELHRELVRVDGGARIDVGGLALTALHTPGHTPGSTTWAIDGAVFSGDTLFVNACGRCDLRGGNAEEMWRSLRRLAELGDDVVLHPGHDYGDVKVSSIGRERAHNPYFARLSSLAGFVALRMRPRG